MRKISIVIPVRNEAAIIGSSLSALDTWRDKGHEVLVVDGMSTDATADIATPLCDRVIRIDPCRATQMNAGAATASGDLLVFLHADTRLPQNAEAELLRIEDDHQEYWGRFDVALDARPMIYRIIESLMNWRSRVSGVATGDQAIFVTRSLFECCGGFPPIALMEDIAFSKKLRAISIPICLTARVVTSARRWRRDGVALTIIRMWWLRAAFFFGVSPQRLRATYEHSAAVDP